jgi:hypothetical protein
MLTFEPGHVNINTGYMLKHMCKTKKMRYEKTAIVVFYILFRFLDKIAAKNWQKLFFQNNCNVA